jgi:hypothetical protein
VPISLQKGVLRTNCLDCLDRTNIAQFAYGLASLSHQLYELDLIDTHEVAINDNLSHILMNLYEQMGDALSMQYTGSAALNKVCIIWEFFLCVCVWLFSHPRQNILPILNYVIDTLQELTIFFFQTDIITKLFFNAP